MGSIRTAGSVTWRSASYVRNIYKNYVTYRRLELARAKQEEALQNLYEYHIQQTTNHDSKKETP